MTLPRCPGMVTFHWGDAVTCTDDTCQRGLRRVCGSQSTDGSLDVMPLVAWGGVPSVTSRSPIECPSTRLPRTKTGRLTKHGELAKEQLTMRRRIQTRTLPSILTMILLTFGVVLATSATAWADVSIPVRPHQHFQALINGQNGSANPVVIRMACVGPIRPGQTGHAFGGQTIAVRLATGTGSSFGYTGSSATSIRAFFGAPPPGGTGASTNTVNFTLYETKALPTSLVLPCAGKSTVTFVPLPMSPPTSRSAAVPVVYEGQP